MITTSPARRAGGVAAVALLLGAVTLPAIAAEPGSLTGTYRRVDSRPDGSAPQRGSSAPALSANGRYSAFTSGRDVLGGSAAGSDQVYLEDGVTGRTSLVSHGVRGRFGNGESYLASISDDGRYVVYTSAATNLVRPPAPGGQNVYRFDARTGENLLISAPRQEGSGAAASAAGQTSGNGRYVAFATDAALIATDTNQRSDVYRWDARTDRLRRVTDTPADGPAAGSYAASVSNDGRVAFLSDALQLTPDTPPSQGNTPAYVWDPATNRTALVSADPSGAPVSPSDFPKISDDGRYVTYPALVVPDNRLHLFSYTVSSRSRVEITAPEADPRDVTGGATSADGRQVLITWSNGIFGTSAYRQTVALYDRHSRRYRVVTERTDVTAFDLSADGRHVGFLSAATDLVTAPDTNGTDDGFVWSRR